MEGVGFEPTKAEPSDLQSDPFGRSGTPPLIKRRIVSGPILDVKHHSESMFNKLITAFFNPRVHRYCLNSTLLFIDSFFKFGSSKSEFKKNNDSNGPAASSNAPLRKGAFILSILIVITLSYIGLSIHSAKQRQAFDFTRFHVAAQHVWQHRPVYEAPNWTDYYLSEGLKKALKANHPRGAQNLNPPFMILLTSPLGLLSYETATFVWLILNLAGLFIGTACLCMSGEASEQQCCRLKDKGAIWCIALSASLPTYTNFYMGELGLIIFALFYAAVALFSKHKMGWAGMLFGLLCALKLFFGLVLLLFLIHRRYRLFFWSSTSFLLFSLLPLLYFNFDTYIDYFNQLKGIDWYLSYWNGSLFGMLHRINMPNTARGILHLTLSLLLILGIRRWSSKFQTDISQKPPDKSLINSNDSNDFQRGFLADLGYVLIIMLLISPLGWIYYFPLLLLPILLTLHHLPKQHSMVWFIALLISLFLMDTPLMNSLDIRGFDYSISHFFAYSFESFALIILLCCYQFGYRQASHNASDWKKYPIAALALPFLPSAWQFMQSTVETLL